MQSPTPPSPHVTSATEKIIACVTLPLLATPFRQARPCILMPMESMEVNDAAFWSWSEVEWWNRAMFKYHSNGEAWLLASQYSLQVHRNIYLGWSPFKEGKISLGQSSEINLLRKAE